MIFSIIFLALRGSNSQGPVEIIRDFELQGEETYFERYLSRLGFYTTEQQLLINYITAQRYLG